MDVQATKVCPAQSLRRNADGETCCIEFGDGQARAIYAYAVTLVRIVQDALTARDDCGFAAF